MRWLGLATVALVGCFHSTRAESTASNASPGSTATGLATDTIWYISARAREEGRTTTRLADSLEYGIVVADHQRGSDLLTQDLDLEVRDSTRLTRDEFIASLRARASEQASADTAVVLYVHGFGTWQLEALRHAAYAFARSQSRIPWVVFCWPSKGSGLASPGSRAVFTTAYWNDSTAAASSKPAFIDAANVVLDAVGGRNTVLLAHSMGAQLAASALADDALRARLSADRLRALAFFAPDVDARRFADTVVPSVQPLANRRVLYASEKDRTLAISKVLNKGDRAGLIRGANGLNGTTPLEVIDITEGSAAEGWWQRLFGSHHSMSRASAALFDLMHIVTRGFPPDCRSTLGTATLRDAGDWRLTDVPPPSPRAVDACAAAP